MQWHKVVKRYTGMKPNLIGVCHVTIGGICDNQNVQLHQLMLTLNVTFLIQVDAVQVLCTLKIKFQNRKTWLST